MKSLIDGKKALLRFYSRFDTYLTAALKFGIAFFTLYYLCERMGYMKPMAELPILLIIAAFCSFMSSNTLLLAVVVYLEAQFYGHSLEAAIVGGIVLLIFLLLYYSFISGQAYVVILTALGISLQMPLAVPMVCGLLMGPGAFAGIAFGTILYYVIVFLGGSGAGVTELGEALFNRILQMLQTVLLQEDLLMTLVILMAVFFVVYLIRRLPVKYSWSIAIAAGIVVYCLLTSMEIVVLQKSISLVMFVVNLAVSAVAGGVVQFFAFGLDYRKVQYLQFEDDDYYYYVKAVSKWDRPEEDEDYYLD